MSQMWIEGALELANVVVSYKILPLGLEVNLNELQKEIEKVLPSKAKVISNYQIEPIAFGLNALIAHIQIPEDETGILDEIEHKLEEIPLVSRIQPLMVRRTR